MTMQYGKHADGDFSSELPEWEENIYEALIVFSYLDPQSYCQVPLLRRS